MKLAVPNKGRLHQEALDLLNRAGLKIPYGDRRLTVTAGGGKYQVLFVQTKDIPEYVEMGASDAGITGWDLVREQGADVERLLDLGFGRCKLVVAAPRDLGIGSVEEIPKGIRVATAFPKLTEQFFKKNTIQVQVIPVSGATEVTPSIDVAEIITDITETGTTLQRNGLEAIGTILESEAVLIANRTERADELNELVMSLNSVLSAARKRYLMANVPKENLDRVRALLPGISGPTVVEVVGSDEAMVAVHAVVDEMEINGLIPRLKQERATGILVLPIERMVG
ncbi:MAG: ATP phosphoribosyltransferase [Candidatus Bipolaricaulia bacterium]